MCAPRFRPVQPVSTFSRSVRSAFKANSQAWATTLTAAQRAQWIAFASVHPFLNVFGDSITLSGIAMYQAVNQRLALCGEAVLAVPPSTFVVADLGTITVAATVAAGLWTTLTVTPGRTLLYNEGLYVFMTPGLPPGVRVQRTDYRLLNSPVTTLFLAATNLATPVSLRLPGPLWPVGKQYSLLVACMNAGTGAISAPIVYSAVV